MPFPFAVSAFPFVDFNGLLCSAPMTFGQRTQLLPAKEERSGGKGKACHNWSTEIDEATASETVAEHKSRLLPLVITHK